MVVRNILFFYEYVFEKNSAGQYEQASKLVASDGAAGDWFGYAVAASDGMVVVAATGDDDKGSRSGLTIISALFFASSATSSASSSVT